MRFYYAHTADGDCNTLDFRIVKAEIRAIRGIGEKRAEEIMTIFERHLGIIEEESLPNEA